MAKFKKTRQTGKNTFSFDIPDAPKTSRSRGMQAATVKEIFSDVSTVRKSRQKAAGQARQEAHDLNSKASGKFFQHSTRVQEQLKRAVAADHEHAIEFFKGRAMEAAERKAKVSRRKK